MFNTLANLEGRTGLSNKLISTEESSFPATIPPNPKTVTGSQVKRVDLAPNKGLTLGLQETLFNIRITYFAVMKVATNMVKIKKRFCLLLSIISKIKCFE